MKFKNHKELIEYLYTKELDDLIESLYFSNLKDELMGHFTPKIETQIAQYVRKTIEDKESMFLYLNLNNGQETVIPLNGFDYFISRINTKKSTIKYLEVSRNLEDDLFTQELLLHEIGEFSNLNIKKAINLLIYLNNIDSRYKNQYYLKSSMGMDYITNEDGFLIYKDKNYSVMIHSDELNGSWKIIKK